MPVRSASRLLLERDRLIVAVALVIIVTAAAVFILMGGGTGMSTLQMTRGTGPLGALATRLPDMIRPEVWTPSYGLTIFVMWWLMMVAMMLPSVAPVILLHDALFRHDGPRAAFAFMAGYLIVWAGFSALAALLQAGLAAAGQISAMYMTLAVPLFGAAVLIGVGLYQFTRLKAACLDSCRGPVEVLTRYRYTGRAAALRMGLRHGATCLGCCWALMVLLFVGGVMNLWWIIGLAVYVAAEKLSPWGPRLARPFGGLLILAGIALLAVSLGAA